MSSLLMRVNRSNPAGGESHLQPSNQIHRNGRRTKTSNPDRAFLPAPLPPAERLYNTLIRMREKLFPAFTAHPG